MVVFEVQNKVGLALGALDPADGLDTNPVLISSLVKFKKSLLHIKQLLKLFIIAEVLKV